MRIIHLKRHTKEEMINRMKKVTLLNSEKFGNPVFIYKNARIEIVEVPISSVFPAQFYELKDTVLRMAALQKELEKIKIDLLNLDGYITYRTSEGNIFYTLLPMVIENQVEKNGEVVPLIVDGLHRILLVRQQKRASVEVIKISNAEKDYPFAAYRNPHGWKDVKPVSKPPASAEKRLWRFPVEKAYNYYRNFNSAFDNVGKPRQ